MKLTDAVVRSLTFKDKPTKHRDGNGLYLHLMKSGKYWRYDYRYANKRKTLSIGVYPKVSLKSARIALHDAKGQLEQGIDPSYQKQLVKHVSDDHRFEAVAKNWLSRHDCTDRTRNDIKLRFEKDVYPLIGEKLVQTIKPVDVIAVIRRIESRGSFDVAHRVCTNISQVMRDAVAYGTISADPCRDLKGAIKNKKETKHYPAITNRQDFGQLLRDIDTYSLNMVVAMALRLSPYVALRPTELRSAPWHEIEWGEKQWVIPKERMKKEKEHIVPLSKQAYKILSDIRAITGKQYWIFPSPLRGKDQPISESTLTTALDRLGYSGKHTPHGFRSSFSTITNESELFSPDVVELQLSHLDKDRVRAAYQRGIKIERRRLMMQWWADEVDAMRLSQDH